MKKDILKFISNWHDLLKSPTAQSDLLSLFGNANEICFPKVDFAKSPCFGKDAAVLYFGVSDDKDVLYGILMKGTDNNLDSFFLDTTDVLVEEFLLETPAPSPMPTPTNTPPFFNEQITYNDATARVGLWYANKSAWVTDTVSEMPRYITIPSSDLSEEASYTMKLALKPFMGAHYQLDLVVRNNTNGIYADAVRVVPPCRPRPFWWD